MGDVDQVEREVEHLRVVITRLGEIQPEGKSEYAFASNSRPTFHFFR